MVLTLHKLWQFSWISSRHQSLCQDGRPNWVYDIDAWFRQRWHPNKWNQTQTWGQIQTCSVRSSGFQRQISTSRQTHPQVLFAHRIFCQQSRCSSPLTKRRNLASTLQCSKSEKNTPWSKNDKPILQKEWARWMVELNIMKLSYFSSDKKSPDCQQRIGSYYFGRQ